MDKVIKDGVKIKNERCNKEKNRNSVLEYLKFYNKELKKAHIICFFLMLIIYAYSVGVIIDKEEIEFMEEVTKVAKTNIILEKVVSVFLIVASGITPFVFIPIIGVIGVPMMLSANITNTSIIVTILTSALSILQMFFIALCVSVGMYFCRSSTKKFRYRQKTSFSLDDVIQQVYEIKKDQKKLEEFKKKRLLKAERQEKLNIKTKYKMILITFIISIIPIIILTAISGV